MISFIILLFLLVYTGIMVLNIFKKEIKISHILCFAFPIGIVIHTLIFSLFLYFRIDYSFIIFTIISLIFTLSIFKNKIRIKNDLKEIPIYLIIILLLFGMRLIVVSINGFVDFYNFDEFSAYQKNSYLIEMFHDYPSFFGTYSPINYFLGTKTYETLGFSVNYVRGLTPIFYILSSFFIFISLKENKINKHISALVSIIFLLGSSELIILSKTFYNNIYFLYFFTTSIYIILKFYNIDKKTGIPYDGLLLFIGLLLTRKDALLLGIAFIVFYMVINLFKKRIDKKQFIKVLFVFLFIAGSFYLAKWVNAKYFTEKVVIKNYSKAETVTSNLNTYKEKLEISNIKLFIKSLYSQTFDFGYYYYNWLMFLVFGISSIVSLIVLFSKNTLKEYKGFILWTKLIQFGYIAFVLLTELFVFTLYEFTLAASFSRYVLCIIPIDFIIIGIVLFGDNKLFTDDFKKKHKIMYNLFLFILFACIPIVIEKFIFMYEPFKLIRFLIIFIFSELLGFIITIRNTKKDMLNKKNTI